MNWSAVAHAFPVPGESIRTDHLKIRIAGAINFAHSVNYRIWVKTGKKKKTPSV